MISVEVRHQCGFFFVCEKGCAFVHSSFFTSLLQVKVILNLSTSWFTDVWQTHPMQMFVSWFMVYPCLPTV